MAELALFKMKATCEVLSDTYGLKHPMTDHGAISMDVMDSVISEN